MPTSTMVKQELLQVHYDDLYIRHLRVKKTVALLWYKFYWEGMKDDIKEYIYICAVC
jgi:Ni,Fe-hydrogenase I cytochrome b subunit